MQSLNNETLKDIKRKNWGRERYIEFIKEIEKRITPLEKRIKSPNFFNNAPEEIVLKEKDRLEEQSNRMSQLKEILKSIS